MKDAFTHTIDGRGVPSASSFDVINPATGAVFARCPDASRAQLDEAVAAARRAFGVPSAAAALGAPFGVWSRLSFDERRKGHRVYVREK